MIYCSLVKNSVHSPNIVSCSIVFIFVFLQVTHACEHKYKCTQWFFVPHDAIVSSVLNLRSDELKYVAKSIRISIYEFANGVCVIIVQVAGSSTRDSLPRIAELVTRVKLSFYRCLSLSPAIVLATLYLWAA